MSPILFIPIAVLLIGGAFVVGIIRNRNFDRKERLHHQLARKLGLSVSYLNEKNFTLFGNYRGYNLRVEAIQLPGQDPKEQIAFVKCSLPMINPQLKLIRMAKPHGQYPHLDKIAFLDRPVSMSHEMGDWIQIYTNDLMFGSILLSDDIKISVYEVFNPISTGLLYIEGEELAFISPELVLEAQAVQGYTKAIDLLCDIKDELNS